MQKEHGAHLRRHESRTAIYGASAAVIHGPYRCVWVCVSGRCKEDFTRCQSTRFMMTGVCYWPAFPPSNITFIAPKSTSMKKQFNFLMTAHDCGTLEVSLEMNKKSFFFTNTYIGKVSAVNSLICFNLRRKSALFSQLKILQVKISVVIIR